MIAKWIWKIWHKQLIAYYISIQNTPATHKDLEYAFTDLNGKKYYRFPREAAMTIERTAKIQEYMIWISRALSGDEIDDLVDMQLEAIGEGLEKANNAARVAAIGYEMKQRKDMIFPISLLYNYLAVQYVREDEDPNSFSEPIQMEKVAQFASECETNNSFFFQVPELETLKILSNVSETEYKNRLAALMTEEKIQRKRIEILR